MWPGLHGVGKARSLGQLLASPTTSLAPCRHARHRRCRCRRCLEPRLVARRAVEAMASVRAWQRTRWHGSRLGASHRATLCGGARQADSNGSDGCPIPVPTLDGPCCNNYFLASERPLTSGWLGSLRPQTALTANRCLPDCNIVDPRIVA